MTGSSGMFEQREPAERACAAAGLLAEEGVTDADVIEPDGRARRLAARETDLPALLIGAAAGTRVRSADGRVELVVEADAVRWSVRGA